MILYSNTTYKCVLYGLREINSINLFKINVYNKYLLIIFVFIFIFYRLFETSTHLVTATAISYTGNRRSLNRYLPMSVSAAAESMASLPTLFLSKYGVASLA